MRRSHRVAVPLALAAVVGLTACAPALPASVVPGSAIDVGWTETLTSANAAAQPTPGNVDIAAMTRAGFGELIGGEFVADAGFGTVTIVDDEPFTVRYDLAEPSWSDGIPLDAADLLLGWAAASGLLAPADESDTGAAQSVVPRVDEFARAIEVTFPVPLDDWQQGIAVAVPAHIVARGALGIDDPMEAKQAMITAILDGDEEALASIADFWNDGFALDDGGGIPADLLLSSGPFRVEAVSAEAEGQRVTLVPNAAYRGALTPKVAEIELVPAGDDPLALIGDGLDVVQIAPLAADRDPIDALTRRDFVVETTHDGTLWALQLNPAGVFARPEARAAFLRATPASTLSERGGGTWASAYPASTSMLSVPGTRAYDIVNQDSGFAAALTGADEPAAERAAAGIAPGSPVCVVYDRASEFAVGAFAALRDAVQEAGWSAVDCGTDDVDAAVVQGGWDAVISRAPVPQTAADIAARWGSGGASSLVGYSDPARDALIAQLAQTTDVYVARDLRAQIEASIVRAAAALPIALNARVTVVDKDVIGVATRDGARAPLTSGAAQWEVVP